MQVPVALVDELMPVNEMEKYRTYEVRNFVENNRSLAWCPGKACEAAGRVGGGGSRETGGH